MENLAFGDRLTVMSCLMVSEQPMLDMAMSVTLYVPA